MSTPIVQSARSFCLELSNDATASTPISCASLRKRPTTDTKKITAVGFEQKAKIIQKNRIFSTSKKDDAPKKAYILNREKNVNSSVFCDEVLKMLEDSSSFGSIKFTRSNYKKTTKNNSVNKPTSKTTQPKSKTSKSNSNISQNSNEGIGYSKKCDRDASENVTPLKKNVSASRESTTNYLSNGAICSDDKRNSGSFSSQCPSKPSFIRRKLYSAVSDFTDNDSLKIHETSFLEKNKIVNIYETRKKNCNARQKGSDVVAKLDVTSPSKNITSDTNDNINEQKKYQLRRKNSKTFKQYFNDNIGEKSNDFNTAPENTCKYITNLLKGITKDNSEKTAIRNSAEIDITKDDEDSEKMFDVSECNNSTKNGAIKKKARPMLRKNNSKENIKTTQSIKDNAKSDINKKKSTKPVINKSKPAKCVTKKAEKNVSKTDSKSSQQKKDKSKSPGFNTVKGKKSPKNNNIHTKSSDAKTSSAKSKTKKVVEVKKGRKETAQSRQKETSMGSKTSGSTRSKKSVEARSPFSNDSDGTGASRNKKSNKHTARSLVPVNCDEFSARKRRAVDENPYIPESSAMNGNNDDSLIDYYNSKYGIKRQRFCDDEDEENEYAEYMRFRQRNMSRFNSGMPSYQNAMVLSPKNNFNPHMYMSSAYRLPHGINRHMDDMEFNYNDFMRFGKCRVPRMMGFDFPRNMYGEQFKSYYPQNHMYNENTEKRLMVPQYFNGSSNSHDREVYPYARESQINNRTYRDTTLMLNKEMCSKPPVKQQKAVEYYSRKGTIISQVSDNAFKIPMSYIKKQNQQIGYDNDHTDRWDGMSGTSNFTRSSQHEVENSRPPNVFKQPNKSFKNKSICVFEKKSFLFNQSGSGRQSESTTLTEKKSLGSFKNNSHTVQINSNKNLQTFSNVNGNIPRLNNFYSNCSTTNTKVNYYDKPQVDFDEFDYTRRTSNFEEKSVYRNNKSSACNNPNFSILQKYDQLHNTSTSERFMPNSSILQERVQSEHRPLQSIMSMPDNESPLPTKTSFVKLSERGPSSDAENMCDDLPRSDDDSWISVRKPTVNMSPWRFANLGG